MDAHNIADIKRGSTINPADLHTDSFQNLFDTFCAPSDAANLNDLSTVDSAVDLTSYDGWDPTVKIEPSTFDQFFHLGEVSESSTPSPSTDQMIFSQANSPGDFTRDLSQSSSPEVVVNNASATQDVKPVTSDDEWRSIFATPEVIHIPQQSTLEMPQVRLFPDKTKTRAETQIKVNLTLDPLDTRCEFIHFPRKTLAKPKLLASEEEQKELLTRGDALHMDVFLVCATAVEEPERLEQALRRARGDEPIPRRPTGIAISELDKEDPAHPQNGGEVLICEGCKERERKRYDRKKKRAEDEEEWWSYEDDRIIMINEKEFKAWKPVETGNEQQFSSRAKQVEFAMRIACYCRHQEEKSPVGYRVIFTFNDSNGNLVTQHTSEIFQITDDHKNKEVVPEVMPAPRPINVPQPYGQPQYHNPPVVPVYQYPTQDTYMTSPTSATFPQAPPVAPTFQSPVSPMDAHFPQAITPTGPSMNPPPVYSNVSTPAVTPSQSSMSRASTYFETPVSSPTGQVPPMENPYLPRPVSMDNFNFSHTMQYPQNTFASAPPSTASTPINLSRPASPTWEQGPNKKKMMCFYFYVDDE